MSQAQPTTDHFDRFENTEGAHAYVEEREQRQQEQQAEALELYGTARQLFLNRYLDTFEVERHGTAIEFYRPVGANSAKLDDFEDREQAQWLRRGAEYLEEVEQRRIETIQNLQSDDVDLTELYDEALDGTELMRKTLSAHAVDESFHDPDVWSVIFRDDDTISEVFDDFTAEGEAEKQQQKLAALQNMMSDDNSPN
ncbi:hypothetical protein [Halorarum salinum]|uniref:Uncharacterized protein n=1 Tax=Halorarum salinum TaxID=2743089 RepID=A0A7D5QD79_9EURY|nr:hypothetical protein [Halobaculum salinum]QLG63080.1 hypothetical protein HUG12_15605 [Halobaculum salinum]